MNKRHAFTLIELLVVITIISILVTLVTFAVNGAMRAAKRTRIATEMSQIAFALDMYKKEFGEYPPDLFDDAALVRHIKKRWPRFELPAGQDGEQANAVRIAISNAYRANSALPIDLRKNDLPSAQDKPDPARMSSLALWLGGFPNPDGKLSGFAADPEAPFGRWSGSVNDGQGNLKELDDSDIAALKTNFQFDKKTFLELTIGTKVLIKEYHFSAAGNDQVRFFPYIANTSARSGEPVPYVYFCSKTDGGSRAFNYEYPATMAGITMTISARKKFHFDDQWGPLGTAVPYVKQGNVPSEMVWHGAGTYQLIHPGLDGKFGNINDTAYNLTSYFRSTDLKVSDNKISQDDLDNITNFSDFNTVQSVIP